MAPFIPLTEVISILGTAVLVLALAIMLLVIDFANRVHRAFALLLLFQSLGMATLALESRFDDLAGRLHIYTQIAVPFAALHFVHVYRQRYTESKHIQAFTSRWVVPVLIFTGWAVAEGLYLMDHRMVRTVTGYGPLVVFTFLTAPSYAALGLLFAIGHRRESAPTRRRALFLAAAGLSLEPLFYSSFRMTDLVLDGLRGQDLFPDVLQVVETIAYAACLVVVGASVALMQGSTTERSRALWTSAWIASAFSGVLVAFFFMFGEGLGGPIRLGTLLVFRALWSIPLPLLVTYALLRHRLFDSDVHLRFAIKGTTLGAIGIAVFFAVSEIAAVVFQRVFESTFLQGRAAASIFGILAASLVVFALVPVQRLAERLSQRAVEGAKPVGSMTHETRLDLYREQLAIAWGDGAMTPKERLLMERLRQHLDLQAEEALAIEAEVAGSRVKRAPPQRRAARSA